MNRARRMIFGNGKGETRLTERARCFKCGWKGDAHDIHSDMPERELSAHKCPGTPQEGNFLDRQSAILNKAKEVLS